MQCGICGATGNLCAVDRYKGYTLYHCLVCDVQFWHPIRNPGPDFYEPCTTGLAGAWFGPSAGHRQFLRDRPAPGGKLLDVGCGTGVFLKAAQDAGYEVTGIDFCQTFVEFARSHFHLHRVHTADVRTYAEESSHARSYDIVTAFEVLEHQDDVSTFMDSLVRLLEPGGFVALSVPNRERWRHVADDWDYPPHHLTRWNASSLVDLCVRHGLSVLSTRTEDVSAGEAAIYLKSWFGYYRVANRLLRSLRKRSTVRPRGADLPIATSRVLLQTDRIAQKIMLPVTAPLSITLRLANRAGRGLYLLAQCQPNPESDRSTVRCGRLEYDADGF